MKRFILILALVLVCSTQAFAVGFSTINTGASGTIITGNPKFLAYSSANNIIGPATPVAGSFTTILHDNWGGFDGQGSYTIQVAGYYDLEACGACTLTYDSANGAYTIVSRILANGAEIGIGYGSANNDGNTPVISVVAKTTKYLAKGTVISSSFRGGNGTEIVAAGVGTYLKIEYKP